jgi:hypothetical protein
MQVPLMQLLLEIAVGGSETTEHVVGTEQVGNPAKLCIGSTAIALKIKISLTLRLNFIAPYLPIFRSVNQSIQNHFTPN